VLAKPVQETPSPHGVDAVIVGGALYGNRWLGPARRFVSRHVAHLRQVPVWFFSSGPLDESADQKDIPPTFEVAVLAERVGANGHITFGGRLESGAKGFPASAMAKKKSGDWRNPERVRAWAAKLAHELPSARPGTPIDHPAHSIARLLLHGVAGWAAYALLMTALARLTSPAAALLVQAIAAPSIFATVARNYFRARGSRDPLVTAIAWTSIVAVLDLAMAYVTAHRFLTYRGVLGTCLTLALVLAAVWTVGTIAAILPSAPARRSSTTL
jgi:menaquinone-dependent protoporphyrinogen oxidase